MNPVFRTLFTKELREAVRDKRALMSALLYAFFGPLVLAAALNFAIANQEQNSDIFIRIEGAEYAPVLVQMLAEQHILVLDNPTSEAQKPWAKTPITLTIPADYQDKVKQAIAAELILSINQADKNLQSANNRVKNALLNYANELATYRLIMRGIDPHLLRPLKLSVQDQASAQEKSGMIMGMLSVFVLMSVFVSSTSLAIDASAGERERNALELILCQPITTTELVLAKLTAVSLLGSFGALLTLSVTSVVMDFVPLAKLGIGFSLTPLTIGHILLAMVPLAVFAAAFQLFCAFQARSFKEAQSYISLSIMLPLTIPFAVQFMPHKPDWIDWVPIASQSQLVESIAKGQAMAPLAVITGALLTLLLAGLLTFAMTRILKSEKAILAL